MRIRSRTRETEREDLSHARGGEPLRAPRGIPQQQVFAGTDFGLYFTNDITAASPVWQRFASGLPNVMVWSLQIDRGNTTLSVWTRSPGAYVWALSSAPL